ncbi:MAG: flavodoxin-dependent (E)-4-hydroxy-3-methylbut-2-enyl-diphosphate synthase [Planctomycetota bacterium]
MRSRQLFSGQPPAERPASGSGYTRRPTRGVRVGDLVIGDMQPVRVQSMTTTDARDVAATIAEAKRLEAAGCELVRVTVPTLASAECIPEIRRALAVPFIADIHFNYKCALRAIELGADKVRINPGNIGDERKVRQVVEAAKSHGTPLRLGVNSGSLEKDLLEKHGWPSPEALAESALRHVEFCRALGFDQVIVAIKSTDVRTAIRANHLFAEQCDVPIHIGVTEAGMAPYGAIKSAIGLGALLLDGIGDTIRVSLTGDPVAEIPVAYDILKASGARVTSPEIVACPTCGRIAIDLEKIVKEVERRLEKDGVKTALRISVLGCVVNGPGEAREADIGIAGGNGEGFLYRHGELVRRVRESELVDALMDEIRSVEAAMAASGRGSASPGSRVRATPETGGGPAPHRRTGS